MHHVGNFVWFGINVMPFKDALMYYF